MIIVPLTDVPSQTLTIVLNSQVSQIHVYQRSTGLYLDLSLNNTATLTGVLCLDRVQLVRDAYLGFVGELGFFDTQGTTDPSYLELGSRWLLGYFFPTEMIPPPVVVPLWVPASGAAAIGTAPTTVLPTAPTVPTIPTNVMIT